MPIKVTCMGCQKSYSVPDWYAGKTAKCPNCQMAFTVSADALGSGGAAAGAGGKEQWRVKTADGETYGPVSKTELDQWVAEGRLDENSQLLQEGRTQWQWATELYPQLKTSSASAPGVGMDFSGVGGAGSGAPTGQEMYMSGLGLGEGAASGASAAANPYAYAGSGATMFAAGPVVRPHRGNMILTCGIISVVIGVLSVLILCCIFCIPMPIAAIGFGIPAWVMGQGDLNAMRRGMRDPRGRGLTNTGMVLGIIGLILGVLMSVLYLILLILGITMHAVNMNQFNQRNF